MSFQDTCTPQYPEMQKTETLRLAKKSSAKTRRQQAKHRHNKKSGRTFITVWASRAGFEPAFRLDLLSLQPFKP